MTWQAKKLKQRAYETSQSETTNDCLQEENQQTGRDDIIYNDIIINSFTNDMV